MTLLEKNLMMTSTQEIRLALSDIQLTLEPLVIGALETSVPIMRARYQLTLVKEMLAGDRQWGFFRQKVAEFDKRHSGTFKKVAKAES